MPKILGQSTPKFQIDNGEGGAPSQLLWGVNYAYLRFLLSPPLVPNSSTEPGMPFVCRLEILEPTHSSRLLHTGRTSFGGVRSFGLVPNTPGWYESLVHR